MSYGDKDIERFIGRTIEKIYMNENNLKFETDLGDIVFRVEGDCCSYSYLHDFIGVKKLLKGHPVVSVKQIDLQTTDSKVQVNYNDDDQVQCYSYEIVTEDPTLYASTLNLRNNHLGARLPSSSKIEKVMHIPQLFTGSI